MTNNELSLIERSLGISLPNSYKKHLVPFPVPALRGNASCDLWDDAQSLIDFNRKLRTSFFGGPPWPAHWYFIGDPGSMCVNAIDLRTPTAEVSWVDHCHLQTVQGISGEPFVKWLQNWVSVIRSDLVTDGIDPDGPPESTS